MLYNLQYLKLLIAYTYNSQADKTIVCDMSASVKYPEGNMEDK